MLWSGYVHHIDFIGNAMADTFADFAAEKGGVPENVVEAVSMVEGRTRNVQKRLVAILEKMQVFEAALKRTASLSYKLKNTRGSSTPKCAKNCCG